MRTSRKTAFSLIELLVVLSTTSLLMAILLPSLSRARQQARGAICRSNIRQLYLANTGYTCENDDFYVRAAFDIFELTGFGGRHRWHGVREADSVNPDPALNTFDPSKGPLRDYLADGKVKQCPGIVKFIEDGAMNAFEAGCGGYGYNHVGVGSRAYQYGYCDEAARSSMKSTEIKRPVEKIMFTDTAFVQGDTYKYIIEYSFCEPSYYVFSNGQGGILEIPRPAPSIHFRHHGKTNVVWCDGHVSAEGIDFPESAKDKPEQFRVGWFGPDDNVLFRPWN